MFLFLFKYVICHYTCVYIYISICVYIYISIYLSLSLSLKVTYEPRTARTLAILFPSPASVKSVSPVLLRLALGKSLCDTRIASDQYRHWSATWSPKVGTCSCRYHPSLNLTGQALSWSPQERVPKKRLCTRLPGRHPYLGGHLHGRSALRVGWVGKELDDRWPESVEEQGLLLLVLRHYIQDNILKMYIRQTRQVLSRQYITSTRH